MDFGNWFVKMSKKAIHFTTYISICSVTDILKFCEVFFVHIVKVCFVFKNSHYAYISPYMHKILPALENEKGQQQVKFYKKPLGELIFSRVTNNLKMFCFTCWLGECSKSKITPQRLEKQLPSEREVLVIFSNLIAVILG